MLELIIFLSLGVLIYLLFLLRDKKQKSVIEDDSQQQIHIEDVSTSETKEVAATESEGEECCGQHLVCERDSLLTQNPDIEYYDDEELDILSGINPADYTEDQIQMLQGVFYTLRESDVAGWVRSLQMRNIELTQELREEALLIIRERRSPK